jgi:hypothetical protein
MYNKGNRIYCRYVCTTRREQDILLVCMYNKGEQDILLVCMYNKGGTGYIVGMYVQKGGTGYIVGMYVQQGGNKIYCRYVCTTMGEQDIL